MSSLIIGGLCFLSCNQKSQSKQSSETANSENASEEEMIISKDNDWSERIIVFKSNPAFKAENFVDTLTLYRDGTATNVLVEYGNRLTPWHGYWELGSFKRGDTDYPAIKISFNSEYSSVEYYIEADAHEGDRIYRRFEDMLKKTEGNEIVLEEVYR
jgi:hypothetical protein